MNVGFGRRFRDVKRVFEKLRLCGATVNKLDPFQVVFKKVVEARGWYVNPRAVCERDCHFHLLKSSSTE